MIADNKIPAIRFMGFNGDWEEKELGDESIDISAGGDVNKIQLKSSGKYPVLANALTRDGIVGYYQNEFRIKAPAVTVTGRGDVGHAKARHVNFTPVVRLLSVTTKHDVEFLEKAINNQTVRVESTGVPQLTVPQFSKYEISFPQDIAEEVKIGENFQQLDGLIAQHQKKHDKLLNIKKALLEKMFPRQGAAIPEIRFKGFGGDWKEEKLGDITKITTGNSNREDSGLDGEYTFFDRSEDIRTSDIYLFDCEAIIVAGEGSDFVPKYFVGKFDLHQRTYAITNFDEGDSKFLFYYIHLFRKHFLDHAVGSTVKSLRLPMFQIMPIRHPEKNEQAKIGKLFKQLDRLLIQHKKQLKKLKNIKQACLEKMFV